ncbi:hypothetical protein APHAL10511_000023 [Amanita phalloides]|nr:hypothetical protein APHAL10511_000023 [Amanita phalloides]
MCLHLFTQSQVAIREDTVCPIEPCISEDKRPTFQSRRMDKAKEARDAETAYTKATEAELSKNYDSAFQLYIKSAEVYLHLRRTAFSETQKAKWQTSASKALERAEKIKSYVEKQKAGGFTGRVESTSSAVGPDVRLTPVGVDYFSPREQLVVLKKGEIVNGQACPPWDEPVVQLSPLIDADGYHGTTDQPSLSSEQQRQSPEWRRTANSVVASTRHVLPQEIVQYIVTDCSLCASMVICLEHDRRFNSHLLQRALHSCPEHLSLTRPCGRYFVRILFNGTWRRIAIDDRLPYHATEGTLLCMSVAPPRNNTKLDSRQILWPSLLEKAYMKLMGGYEFPGSISSSDLHTLVGWIPEHIVIRSPHFEREKTWSRILQGLLSGRCMATIGTGPGNGSFWNGKPLLPSHCYPVVDVMENSDGPFVTVLDSWINGYDRDPFSKSRHLVISWSDVISIFDGVYLSWNPDMWQQNHKFHGMWKRRGQGEQAASMTRLQLFFRNAMPDTPVWILLTRHVSDTKRTSDFISLRVEVEEDSSAVIGPVMQLTLTDKGSFTNGVHVLAKTRVTGDSGVLAITASYDGDADDVGYTINAYAGEGIDLVWDESVPQPPYTESVTGSLTARNSGGNGTYPTFMLNPQYYLRLHPPNVQISAPSAARAKKVRTTIVLKSERIIPVNVSMTWSQGERIHVLSQKELAATSGPYSYGLATFTRDLAPGDYSLIVSAFEPHHLGPFSLSVSASSSFDLRPIPQEGAGMYQKVINGEWSAETAGGSPSFDNYATNPVYEIESTHQFQLKLRLQLLNPATMASLNITLYPTPLSSEHRNQTHVATSGPYDDAVCGVATPQVSLNAGKYWAVPSTYMPGVKGEFRLVVYTSVMDIWVQRASDSRT